jgi:hypothetical protein
MYCFFERKVFKFTLQYMFVCSFARLFVSNNRFEDIDCKLSYGELLKWEKMEEAKLLKKKTITF